VRALGLRESGLLEIRAGRGDWLHARLGRAPGRATAAATRRRRKRCARARVPFRPPPSRVSHRADDVVATVTAGGRARAGLRHACRLRRRGEGRGGAGARAAATRAIPRPPRFGSLSRRGRRTCPWLGSGTRDECARVNIGVHGGARRCKPGTRWRSSLANLESARSAPGPQPPAPCMRRPSAVRARRVGGRPVGPSSARWPLPRRGAS
jgi:hypothetical protein